MYTLNKWLYIPSFDKYEKDARPNTTETILNNYATLLDGAEIKRQF